MPTPWVRQNYRTVMIDGRWSSRHVSQDDWALSGDTGDREGDLADSADDREDDPAECGIGDYDGLNEQRV